MLNYSEFLRFCLVGGVSTLLGIALLYIFTEIINIHYILSFIATYIIVNISAYIASRRYTFSHRRNRFFSGALRYYAVSLFSLLLNTVTLYILVNIFCLPYLAASVFLSAINAPINYMLHKRITFQLPVFATRLPKG